VPEKSVEREKKKGGLEQEKKIFAEVKKNAVTKVDGGDMKAKMGSSSRCGGFYLGEES